MKMDVKRHSMYEVPLRILNQGPEYFRARSYVGKRDSGLLQPGNRKSAVELLEESKPLYVKSERVRDSKQSLDNIANLQVGRRRGTPQSSELRKSTSAPLSPSRHQKHSQSSEHTSEFSKEERHHQGDEDGDDDDDDEEVLTSSVMCHSMSDKHATPLKTPVKPAFNNGQQSHGKMTAHKLDWREGHPSGESNSDVTHSSHGTRSSNLMEDSGIVVRRRPKKVQRSKSDISHRFSNSSDLSDISVNRLSRNSADLEKFFNEMGLDRTVLDPLMHKVPFPSHDNIPFMDSVSSLDSHESCSLRSIDSKSKKSDAGLAAMDRGDAPVNSSIVERNARIIKWLCNVKKARSFSASN